MNRIRVVSLISSVVMLASPALAQEYTFVPLDVRCPATAAAAECPAGLAPGGVATQTGARGINPQGDIVGFYVAGGKQRGFLLSDGQFSTLEFPVPGVRSTLANGINPRGEIVGSYVLPVHDLSHPPSEDSPLYCPAAADPACTKAFYYYRGKFTTLRFPNTVDAFGVEHVHPGGIAQRITPDGDIYGCVHDHDLMGSMFGAVWTRSGAAFSLMANGGQLTDSMGVPMSMNNGGTPGGGHVVAGLFTEMGTNRGRGYVVRDGMFEPWDATPTATVTAIWDVGPNQHLVGVYREVGDPATKRHGFVQRLDGAPAITLDFTCQEAAGCAGAPLGTVAFFTAAFGINANGIVVGQYAITNGGLAHAFVAIPTSVE